MFKGEFKHVNINLLYEFHLGVWICELPIIAQEYIPSDIWLNVTLPVFLFCVFALCNSDWVCFISLLEYLCLSKFQTSDPTFTFEERLIIRMFRRISKTLWLKLATGEVLEPQCSCPQWNSVIIKDWEGVTKKAVSALKWTPSCSYFKVNL